VTLHSNQASPTWIVEGSHDGFARLPGGPVHHRIIEAATGRIAVRDAVEGGTGQSAVARLLFHPGLRVHRTPTGVGVSNRRLALDLETAHPVTIDHAWWCPDFNVRIPTTQVAVHYGSAPTGGTFSLTTRRE
jgi:hypothetical protein